MEKQTLDGIYQLYLQDVFYYLLSLCRDHHLAEDITQETFFRAYLHLEDCPGERVKPWLFRVAHNALVDSKRKEKRSIPTDQEILRPQQDDRTPEYYLLVKEQLREVDRIIATLPDQQRQAVVLCDFCDLSYQEGAEVMGVNPGHFKILLFRGRQKIRLQGERMIDSE